LKKVGFIIKNTKKANGKEYEYFYLRKIERLKGVIVNGNYAKKQENLYSFGNREKALKTIKEWESNIKKLPLSLSEMGYSYEDVKRWKEQILSK